MSYLALLAADGEEEDELPPAVIPAAPPAAVTVLEPAAGAVAGSSGGSAAAMASCVHPVSPTSELAAALNAAAICSGRSCSDASGGTMPADAAAAAAEASQQQQQQQQSCGQQLSSYASLNSWFDVDGFNAFESVYGAAAAAADQHQHHPAVALQLPYDDAAATPSAAVCDEDSVGVALLPLSPPFSSSRADSAAVPFRFSSHQNRHDSSSSHVTALPNQLQPQTDCVINAGTSGAAAAASAASQHQLQQAWWPPPAHGRSSLGPLAAGTASAIAASRQHISAAFQYSLGHICNAPLEDGANAAPVMAPPPPLSTLESSAAAQQQQAYHSHRLHDKTSAPGHQTLPYSAQRRSGQVQPHADPSSSLTLGPAAAGSSAAGSGFHHHSGSRVTTTTTTTTTTVFQSSQALQHQLLYQPNTDYSNGGNLYHNQHGAVPAFCTAAAAGGGGSSTEALSTAVDQLFHNTAMQQRDVAGTLCANYSYPNAPAAAAAAQHYAAPYSAIAAPSLGPQAAYRQGAGGKIRSDGVFSAGGGGALPGALTAAAAAPLPVAAGGAASGPLPVVEEVAGNASGRGGGQEARQKHPAAGGVSGSGSGRGNVARKSRANLPASVVRVLRHWLLGHIEHPYPTEPEKQALCSETEITLSQLNNWFINARVRIWKPLVAHIYNTHCRNQQATSSGRTASSVIVGDCSAPAAAAAGSVAAHFGNTGGCTGAMAGADVGVGGDVLTRGAADASAFITLVASPRQSSSTNAAAAPGSSVLPVSAASASPAAAASVHHPAAAGVPALAAPSEPSSAMDASEQLAFVLADKEAAAALQAMAESAIAAVVAAEEFHQQQERERAAARAGNGDSGLVSRSKRRSTSDAGGDAGGSGSGNGNKRSAASSGKRSSGAAASNSLDWLK